MEFLGARIMVYPRLQKALKSWQNAVLISYILSKSKEEKPGVLVCRIRLLDMAQDIPIASLHTKILELDQKGIGITVKAKKVEGVVKYIICLYKKEFQRFIENGEKTNPKEKPEIDPIFVEKAKQFLKAVSSNRRVVMTAKYVQWPSTFQKIRDLDGIAESRIIDVLDWYCDQLRKGLGTFVPISFCANSFREKFYRIENAMKKELAEEAEKVVLDDREEKWLTTMSKDITDQRLKEDTFPHLVRSLNTYRNYLLEALTEYPVYLDKVFRDPLTVTAGYAMWINKNVGGWPSWSGSLEIFEPGGKHFLRYLQEIMTDKGMCPNKTVWRILDATGTD